MSLQTIAKTALLSLAALLGALTPARADENRFGVATIVNQTGDLTVRSLEYRWGDQGEWRKVETEFRPGREEFFWAVLDGNGRTPQLHVRINEAIGNAKTIEKYYRLKVNAAPDKLAKFGHKYVLRRDTQDRDYISFYELRN